MFEVSQTIAYSSIGACKINEIAKNNLTGELREYYVLQPVNNEKNVIYVPVDNEKLVSRIHILPTTKELKLLISQVKDDSLDWIDNTVERSQKFRSILADGDLKNNMILLRELHKRSLYLTGIGRHLPKSDEYIYKDCSKLVVSQISAVLGVADDEALKMVFCDE